MSYPCIFVNQYTVNFPPRKRKGENASPRFPIRIYVRDAIIKKEKHEIGKYLREIGKKKKQKSH